MTISDHDWTRDQIVRGWLDEETPEVAQDAADSEIAYIILNIHRVVGVGWTYSGDGQFGGPYLGAGFDAVDRILTLICAAVDYTIEHLDEIRAEATP
jgi:hypothetical protein